jgi:hypothetical protein
VRRLLEERRGREPPLKRIEVVIYRDSPARDNPYVAELAQSAREVADASGGRITIDFAEPGRNAPTD